MSDEPKISERFSGWKKAGVEKVAKAGGSDDVFRKALALNPSLKGDKSTQQFLDEVGAAKEKGKVQLKAEPKPAQGRPLVASSSQVPVVATSIAETIAVVKAWLDSEAARVDAELSDSAAERQAVSKEQEAAVKAARDQLVELVVRIDPNLLSPKTQALLETESKFLRQVGFTSELVKQRLRKR